MKPYLRIGHPAELPKVKAGEPIVLRQMIDEIIYRAGARGNAGAPNSIFFKWDEESRNLSVEEAEEGFSPLADFAEEAGSYLAVKSPRARLDDLALHLGYGGKVTYGHRGGSKSPFVISITVPPAGEKFKTQDRDGAVRFFGGVAKASEVLSFGSGDGKEALAKLPVCPGSEGKPDAGTTNAAGNISVNAASLTMPLSKIK